MKKLKDFSHKTKKVLILAGTAVVCVGTLAIALHQGAMAESKIQSSQGNSSTVASSEVPVSVHSVSGSTVSGIAGTGSAITPKKGEVASAPLTVTSRPSSTPAKPKVQGDSKDGKQPTNRALTNKTQKLAYVTQPSTSTAGTTTKKSSGSTTTKKSSGNTTTKKSSGGSATGNSILNNAIKEQGGNEQTTVSGDWGGGSQVGIMD